MSDNFFSVLFPGHVRVCGRSLPPLTLYRISCLQVIGSPFLSSSAQGFTLADLLLAIRCIRTPNQVAPNLRPSLRDLITLALHGRSAKYREHHGRNFLTYLSLHQLCPELWRNEDSQGRSISAPGVLSQIAGLMECGLTHSEAWATSPGYATWFLATAAERHTDRVRFFTPEDAEVNRQADEANRLTEEEWIAQAHRDLQPAMFKAWMAKRAKLTPN